jgi:hypothetical protein
VSAEPYVVGNWRVFPGQDYAEQVRGNSWIEVQGDGGLRVSHCGLGDDCEHLDVPAEVFSAVLTSSYARRESESEAT